MGRRLSVPVTKLPVTEIVTLAPLTDRTSAASEQIRGGVISIGNFDGVHRGHANLLKKVCREAKRTGGPAIAVVLDPHPATILRPDRVPPKLTSLSQRAERMSAMGIDFLVVCETTVEFLQLSAESFFQSLVVDRLDCRGVVEGPNFFFGRNRGGNIDSLKSLCQQAGISLDIVEPSVIDDSMISSTRIRELLERGDIESANELLGHHHRLRGTVIAGDRRGREIGFPTANLADIDVVIPAGGVYGGYASINGKSFDAAVHVGPRPTFDDLAAAKDKEDSIGHGSEASKVIRGALTSRVEVHVLDYTGDLYGQTVSVDLVTRVRDVARFDSVKALTDQLAADVRTVRDRLSTKEK